MSKVVEEYREYVEKRIEVKCYELKAMQERFKDLISEKGMDSGLFEKNAISDLVSMIVLKSEIESYKEILLRMNF